MLNLPGGLVILVAGVSDLPLPRQFAFGRNPGRGDALDLRNMVVQLLKPAGGLLGGLGGGRPPTPSRSPTPLWFFPPPFLPFPPSFLPFFSLSLFLLSSSFFSFFFLLSSFLPPSLPPLPLRIFFVAEALFLSHSLAKGLGERLPFSHFSPNLLFNCINVGTRIHSEKKM